MMASSLGGTLAKRIYSVSLTIEQSPLPKTTQHLVMLRASQINGCGWCVDVHSKEAAAAGETVTRLHLVAAGRHARVFTDAERAALALTEEGTRLADVHQGVTDETWALARKHHDGDQMIALVALIAMINASNRLSVILNYAGGAYEAGMFKVMTDEAEG
jgi:AhpD family alkylhydroperoxidase